MSTYATAQLIGGRSHQCDATAVSTAHNGTRAYVLLDGIGSSDEIRDWTRTAARRLARAAAYRGDAEAGLRAVYNRHAAEPERHSLRARMPDACAVVAVTAPRRPLTIAWCGDARAYVLTPDGAFRRLTRDHNMRQALLDEGRTPGPAARNRITSYLGGTQSAPDIGHDVMPQYGRLLLASDGAYEPLEDSCRNLANYLIGAPADAARDFAQAAIDHAGPHVDNATVLIADLQPTN